MGLRNTETEYGSLARSLHWIITIGILALIVLHVLGALYNQFVVKNDVVRRMIVGLK